jgi:hypothetical protein
MSSALRQLAFRGVCVSLALLGVSAVRDATLSTHEPAVPGSEVEVVVSASQTERAEREGSIPETVQALLLTCRLEVPADIVGSIQNDGDGQFRFTLAPALDRTDRRQLRGCIEDWTLDQILVDVVSFEERIREPARSRRR